jgi:GNAT superfamily N-acetyltransferase
MTKSTNDEIRQSTDDDFKAIADWLRDEDKQGAPGSFYCNLEIIEASHREGKLLVYVDGTTGLPVAFQLGGLIGPGILEVRHDMRGRGIGRKLVEHCIEKARARNECILKIECTPPTSIPFWNKMGFKLFDPKAQRRLAYRIVEKRHQLPAGGVPADVVIRFFQLGQRHQKGARPCKLSRPAAVRTGDGLVHLDHQVQFCTELYPNIVDAVVRIDVDGETLCFEKAKYDLAKRLGVQRCPHGFFIDHIDPSATKEQIPR